MTLVSRCVAGRPEEMSVLSTRLRRLAGYAAAGGAAPEQLEEDIAAIFTALLAGDPRVQKSLHLGLRMVTAKTSGCSVSEIADEFGKSESQVHRLIQKVATHMRQLHAMLPVNLSSPVREKT